MAFEIAKAGWLSRQSTVLQRWKKSWVVLYKNGMLRYFETPDDTVAQDAIYMQPSCIQLLFGSQVQATPPPGLEACSLFSIVFTDKSWVFCAESSDDRQAWICALEQARVLEQPAPPPYTPGPYPQQRVVYTHSPYGYAGHPPSYVVHQNPGQTTVVYDSSNPYYYRRRYDGTDMAVGMMAGAALGTMMWGPLLWW